MATKLQCEICGGKLIGKPGGIFECENCGTEYSTEWAKAKIQEITGTVKVEGTVEVQGSVQVEGAANKDSMLKRAQICLNDRQWDKAKELCEQALNIDPESGSAYLYLTLACMKRPDIDRLTEPDLSQLETKDDEKGKAWRNALRFADAALSEQLNLQIDTIHRRWIEAKQRSKELSAARGIMYLNYDALVAIDSSGKAHVYAEDSVDWLEPIKSWPPIRQLLLGWQVVIGLCFDGRVRYSSMNKDDIWSKTSTWRDVKLLAWDGYRILVGLKNDGTLYSAYDPNSNYGKDSFEFAARGWGDVKEIIISEAPKNYYSSNKEDVHFAVGIMADGTKKTTSLRGETYLGLGHYFLDETLPFAEKGYEVVSVDHFSDYRLGLNGCVWEKNKADVITPLPVSKEIRVVAVEGCTYSNPIAYAALLTETGRVLVQKPGNSELIDLGWKLFDHWDSLEEERAIKVPEQMEKERRAAAERAEAERKAAAEEAEAERIAAAERAEAERKAKIADLKKEKADLQAELPTIKGLLSGGKRRQIEARLAEIEAKLKKLG